MTTIILVSIFLGTGFFLSLIMLVVFLFYIRSKNHVRSKTTKNVYGNLVPENPYNTIVDCDVENEIRRATEYK